MRVKARIIWLLWICWAVSLSPLHAATPLTPETYHHIGFCGNASYYGMLADTKMISGFSPAIGAGYRYFHNNLLIQTGLEGQYTWSAYDIPVMEMQVTMLDGDAEPEPFTMKATLFNRSETYKHMSVNIPFYMGYEKWHFYALAGFAASLSMYGTASGTGQLSTIAEYDRYIGIFDDMPNHGLASLPVKSGSMNYKMNINVLLHAEAGGRLDKVRKKTGFNAHNHAYRIYLGAFVDYGVLNSHADVSNGDMLSIEYAQGVQAKVVPLLLSEQMRGKRVNPITAGVKLSVFFELHVKGKSNIYDNKKADRDYIKRGGNQTIIQ